MFFGSPHLSLVVLDGLRKILFEKPIHGYKKSKIKIIYFKLRDRKQWNVCYNILHVRTLEQISRI